MAAVALLAAAVVWLSRASDNPPSAPHQPATPAAPHGDVVAGSPGADAAATPPRLSVTGKRRQRIQGWGISVLRTGPDEPIVSGQGLSRPQLERLDRLIFRKAGINLVRVFGPNQTGTQPQAGVWSRTDQRLDFMRRVRRYGVRFMFTGAGAPLSMRDGNSETGVLIHGQERPYARFLARSLEVAERAGAHFEWAAIGNEPDILRAFWVGIAPDQAAAVYRELARQIRSRGLRTRLVLGDNQGWGRTYEYARREWEHAGVRSLASVVASHDYSGVEPPTVQRVRDFARQRDLSPWMTEWGGGACPTGDCPDDPSIGYAIRFASQISYDLSVGWVQAWFPLQAAAPTTHGATAALVVRDYENSSQPYYLSKRYWILRQFTSVARPGAYRYDVQGTPEGIQAVAFRRRGTTGLVVTNPLDAEQQVTIGLGDREGDVAVHRTSATEDFTRLPRRRYGGERLQEVLPAESVTTFRLDAR
jgi:O-glycosyl hydrolase